VKRARSQRGRRPRPCPVGASLEVLRVSRQALRAFPNQRWVGCAPSTTTGKDQLPLLIMPAPTVTPVASSIRMNEPVLRFFA
jgi:hypothetical protein